MPFMVRKAVQLGFRPGCTVLAARVPHDKSLYSRVAVGRTFSCAGHCQQYKQAKMLLEASGQVQDLSVQRISSWDWQIDLRSIQPQAYATVIQIIYEGELQADPTTRYMNNVPNRFWAYDGELSGEGLRYDNGKRGHDGVTDWTGRDASITWVLRSEEAMLCRVRISYSARSGR